MTDETKEAAKYGIPLILYGALRVLSGYQGSTTPPPPPPPPNVYYYVIDGITNATITGNLAVLAQAEGIADNQYDGAKVIESNNGSLSVVYTSPFTTPPPVGNASLSISVSNSLVSWTVTVTGAPELLNLHGKALNSAGQTVWLISQIGVTLPIGATTGGFDISQPGDSGYPGLPAGTYSVSLFLTDSSGVAVGASQQAQVTVAGGVNLNPPPPPSSQYLIVDASNNIVSTGTIQADSIAFAQSLASINNATYRVFYGTNLANAQLVATATPPPPNVDHIYSITGLNPQGQAFTGQFTVNTTITLAQTLANLQAYGFTNLTYTQIS